MFGLQLRINPTIDCNLVRVHVMDELVNEAVENTERRHFASPEAAALDR